MNTLAYEHSYPDAGGPAHGAELALAASAGRQPLCVFITGPSGVGKSTLLRASSTGGMLAGRAVDIPQRHTTRALRHEREALELVTVGEPELSSRDAERQYIVRYFNYGEHYALPAAPFDAGGNEPVLILQTLPTQVAAIARERLAPRWDVRICMLAADEANLKTRLYLRGDPLTLERLEERVAGSRANYSHLADVVLDANRPAEHVFADFTEWLSTLDTAMPDARALR